MKIDGGTVYAHDTSVGREKVCIRGRSCSRSPARRARLLIYYTWAALGRAFRLGQVQRDDASRDEMRSLEPVRETLG